MRVDLAATIHNQRYIRQKALRFSALRPYLLRSLSGPEILLEFGEVLQAYLEGMSDLTLNQTQVGYRLLVRRLQYPEQ